MAYNQIIATISAQYPSINVKTADGLTTLETSNPDLKASFDAAKLDKDDSELELENAKTAVSDAAEAKPNMQASLIENENTIAALTEQINTDTAKVSPLESKLTTETATLSDLQPQLDNAKNSNVEQLQADVNAKQSVVDTVTKEIESAKADIDKTTKAIADIELKVAREDATNKAELDLKTSKNNAVSEINGLKFLSDKQSFTDKVNAAGSIDAVASILSEAKAQDAAEQLTKSKVDAIADVNALSGLNDSEKASFADKINASTTLNGVASAVSDAKTVAKLNTYKESAKTTVSNLTKLSDESKAGHTNRIKSATSTTNVDAIVAEAKAESQLIQDKESAVSEIKALVNLSDKEQASFVDSVTNAASKSTVDTVVSTAKAQGQKNLEAKQIEELRVDAQKQDFASKVDAAVTKTDVSNLLVNANATNDLEKAKPKATTEINNLKFVQAGQKGTVRFSVFGYNRNLIKTVPKRIGSGNYSVTLKTAKGYTHVSDKIKPTATTAIEAATIVSDANVADALVKNKEDAKSTIDGLKFLSHNVKSEFKDKVEAAKTEADVKSVVDYATQANDDAKQLKDVQAESIEAINGMAHLTQDQKDAFISKINESNLISEVKSILADAVTENKLSEAKAKAVSTINTLTNMSDSEKASFKDKVAAAKAKDAIDPIVSDAKTRDALIGLQNDAIAKVKALTYISADQKTDFVAQIKATTTASAIKPISDAAVQAEAVAKELREAKNAALETAKGYTHVSDKIKTTAIEAATSKDAVTKLIANLKSDEDKAIANELAAAKVVANTTINSMKFLQAGQKDDFVKKANSAKDMTALKTVIDAAVAQDKIESRKGTVTFNVVRFDGKVVTMVTQRIMEGKYSVTLKDLGLTGSNIVIVSGDLTGTIKAQELKTVKIKIVDTTKVQTLILHARDVDSKHIIKSMTVYYVAGQMFAPSYDQFNFNPKNWRTANDVTYANRPAQAGDVAKYTFYFEKVRPVLDEQQTTIAQQELVRLINNYRASYRLSTLATDSTLAKASSIRAKELAQKFDHVRPDGRDFNSVLTQVGYTYFHKRSENIAYFGVHKDIDGRTAALRLFNQWKQHPYNNANMLTASYTHVSFGVYADENGVYSSTVFTG